MAKKADFSNKILNYLADKKAMSVADLKSCLNSKTLKTEASKDSYALTRSIKNLAGTGLIETIQPDNIEYARITKRGKQKLASLKVEGKNALFNPAWDGKWRIVLLDLPESRKAEREAFRYLLKKAGFICLKNSAWVSPHPFEFLFGNIKKDFGFTSEVMIMVTSEIDGETQKYLTNTFSLK